MQRDMMTATCIPYTALHTTHMGAGRVLTRSVDTPGCVGINRWKQYSSLARNICLWIHASECI